MLFARLPMKPRTATVLVDRAEVMDIEDDPARRSIPLLFAIRFPVFGISLSILQGPRIRLMQSNSA
jgi:hypothetical protein